MALKGSELPELLPMPADAVLALWVIWDHPDDVAHAWVLRPQYAMRDGSLLVSKRAWFAQSLDQLQSIVPPGLYCQPRQEGDPPHLFETWF